MPNTIDLTLCIVSFTRKANKDLILSDGTEIPKGTFLLAPSLAISADPEVYPNAHLFDGMRFYKMRQRSKPEENKYQFTSTSKTMLHFGAGRHACPGRWFANTQAKLVISTLILRYDFKFKEGQGRPKSILSQAHNAPNPLVEVLFRKRDH